MAARYTFDKQSMRKIVRDHQRQQSQFANLQPQSAALSSASIGGGQLAVPFLIGKANEDIDAGSSGEAKIWDAHFDGTTAAAAGPYIETVYDWENVGAKEGDKLYIWRHQQSGHLYFLNLKVCQSAHVSKTWSSNFDENYVHFDIANFSTSDDNIFDFDDGGTNCITTKVVGRFAVIWEVGAQVSFDAITVTPPTIAAPATINDDSTLGPGENLGTIITQINSVLSTLRTNINTALASLATAITAKIPTGTFLAAGIGRQDIAGWAAIGAVPILSNLTPGVTGAGGHTSISTDHGTICLGAVISMDVGESFGVSAFLQDCLTVSGHSDLYVIHLGPPENV